jgi:hypothetical protein
MKYLLPVNKVQWVLQTAQLWSKLLHYGAVQLDGMNIQLFCLSLRLQNFKKNFSLLQTGHVDISSDR